MVRKRPKAGLTKKDKDNLEHLLEKAVNSELYWVKEQVEHEISLSEACIENGEEMRR